MDEMVSRSSVIRVPANHQSFWYWFYHLFELIEKNEHVKKLWKDGLIIGFVSKSETEAILANAKPGTFILRFSESKIEGGITVAFFDHHDRKLIMLKPFTLELLKKEGLADLLKNLAILNKIYTANDEILDMDVAFAKHYEQVSAWPKDGNYYSILWKLFIPSLKEFKN